MSNLNIKKETLIEPKDSKIELLKEALSDYNNGKLSSVSTVMIFNMILNKKKPNDKDFEWAHNYLNKIKGKSR